MAKKRRLTPNTYSIVSRAVEEGIAFGIGRCFKYHDGPAMTEDEVRDQTEEFENEIMNALGAVIEFNAPEP